MLLPVRAAMNGCARDLHLQRITEMALSTSATSNKVQDLAQTLNR